MTKEFNLQRFEFGKFEPHHLPSANNIDTTYLTLGNPSIPRGGMSHPPRWVTVMYNTKEKYIIFPDSKERIPYDQLEFEQLLIDRHYKFTKSEPSNDYVTYTVTMHQRCCYTPIKI